MAQMKFCGIVNIKRESINSTFIPILFNILSRVDILLPKEPNQIESPINLNAFITVKNNEFSFPCSYTVVISSVHLPYTKGFGQILGTAS